MPVPLALLRCSLSSSSVVRSSSSSSSESESELVVEDTVAGEAASSSLNTRCTYAINFLKWINKSVSSIHCVSPSASILYTYLISV